jgi:hypothetical protein
MEQDTTRELGALREENMRGGPTTQVSPDDTCDDKERAA